MKINISIAISCLFLIAQSVWAEKGYISDRQALGIYAEPNAEGVATHTLNSGTEVEIFETQGLFVKIRSGDIEGWARARFVTAEKPVSVQLKAAQDENAWLRGQLVSMQGHNTSDPEPLLKTKLSQAEATIKELRMELGKQKNTPILEKQQTDGEVAQLKRQLEQANNTIINLQAQLAKQAYQPTVKEALISDTVAESDVTEATQSVGSSYSGIVLLILGALILGFVSGWLTMSRKVRRSFNGLKIW